MRKRMLSILLAAVMAGSVMTQAPMLTALESENEEVMENGESGSPETVEESEGESPTEAVDSDSEEQPLEEEEVKEEDEEKPQASNSEDTASEETESTTEESASEEEEVSDETEEAETEEEPAEESDEAAPDDATAELIASIQKDRLKLAAATKYDYETELEKFPKSYQNILRSLHKQHPDWVFVADETGQDWNTALTAESSNNVSLVPAVGSSLIKSNAAGDYNVSTGQYIYKDNTQWVSANRPIVSYFMDPRNFLSDPYIWMFENNEYDSSFQTEAAVEKVLSATFMSKARMPQIKYKNAAGKTVTADVTYAETILNAGKSWNVSPLYLASKIRTEIGTNGSGSSSGTYTTDKGVKYNGNSLDGIYNYYNIYASDSPDPVKLGLSWAAGYPNTNGKITAASYGRPWVSPVLSIYHGAHFIYDRYFVNGQFTPYYTRFNVTKTAAENGTLFWHQYMTNASGAAGEALTTYQSYKSLNLVDIPRTFYIPVFKNMPDINETVSFKDSKKTGVTTTSVNMRAQPSYDGDFVKSIPAGTAINIQEGTLDTTGFAWSMQLYPYWYKATATVGGTSYTGYICAEYVDVSSVKTLNPGEQTTLALSKTPSSTVFYQTSDPSVATVDQNGKVTGVGTGSAEIYVYTSHGFDAVGITCKAKNTWTVNFDANGGSVQEASRKVSDGSQIGTLPVPTKSGYVFNGWWTAKTGGSQISTSTKPGAQATYYAQWKTLSAPVMKSAYSFPEGIEVKWNAVSGASKYRIYRKAEGGSWKSVTDVSGTSWTDKSSLTVKTIYYYTVRCLGSDGSVVSDYDKTGVSAAKLAKMTKPTVKLSGTTATVSWTADKSAKGYKLYRKEGNGSWSKLTDIGKGTTTSWTDKNLKKGTTYGYAMTAVYSLGGKDWEGLWSDGVSVTTEAEKPAEKKESYTEYKTTENLNYRTDAGVSAQRVGTLPKGTKVQVVDGQVKTVSGTKWFQILLNGKKYYVSSAYLEKVASSSSSSSSSASQPAKETYTEYKTTANLNYRTGAGTNNQRVGTLANGTKVQVVDGQDKTVSGTKWCQILLNGKKYYVSSAYLTKVSSESTGKSSSSSSGGAASASTSAKYTQYKTTENLNYRTGAGTGNSRVGTLAKGATVQVLDGSGTMVGSVKWVQINLNGKTYYVSSAYLTPVSTSGPAAITTKVMTTTANLNYRTGAGTGYTRVGTLARGTNVQVINGSDKWVGGSKWVQIVINSKTYYVSAAYLK